VQEDRASIRLSRRLPRGFCKCPRKGRTDADVAPSWDTSTRLNDQRSLAGLQVGCYRPASQRPRAAMLRSVGAIGAKGDRRRDRGTGKGYPDIGSRRGAGAQEARGGRRFRETAFGASFPLRGQQHHGSDAPEMALKTRTKAPVRAKALAARVRPQLGEHGISHGEHAGLLVDERCPAITSIVTAHFPPCEVLRSVKPRRKAGSKPRGCRTRGR